jgi:hypothetical protein
MKQYPSITNNNGKNYADIVLATWDKIDGSNLRFEWNRKSGWYKYGTRNRLFDESDPTFGEAIQLFHNTMANDLEKIIKKQNWEQVIVFAEFCGDKSFAGQHEPDDPKRLTLFDVDVYKKGIISSKDFLKLFGDLPIPNYLGLIRWGRNFVEEVWLGNVEGITFEGVVGKTNEGYKIVMRKAKTQAWIDKVHALYSEAEAQKIIDS